jgi:hypothetical protein
VDEVDEAKKKVLEFLKTIETTEDLSNKKDELLDVMEELIKAALTVLEKFLETAMTLDGEELEKQMGRFQDDEFLFDGEIGAEMERIENLEGSEEVYEDFSGQMEARLGPHLEEISMRMAKFMEQMFGGMMQGLAEGMGEAFGGMVDDDEIPEVEPESYDNRVDLGQFEQVYDYLTFGHLQQNKDWIIEALVERLDDDLENLKNMTEMELPKEEILEKLEEVERHATIYIDEISKQFMRIGTLPDAEEYAKSAVSELKEKTKPNVERVMGYRKDLE